VGPRACEGQPPGGSGNGPFSRNPAGKACLTLRTRADPVEDPAPPVRPLRVCKRGREPRPDGARRPAACLHCAAGTRGQVSWCSHCTPWHRPPHRPGPVPPGTARQGRCALWAGVSCREGRCAVRRRCPGLQREPMRKPRIRQSRSHFDPKSLASTRGSPPLLASFNAILWAGAPQARVLTQSGELFG
jgi:hypothetical protein